LAVKRRTALYTVLCELYTKLHNNIYRNTAILFLLLWELPVQKFLTGRTPSWHQNHQWQNHNTWCTM